MRRLTLLCCLIGCAPEAPPSEADLARLAQTSVDGVTVTTPRQWSVPGVGGSHHATVGWQDDGKLAVAWTINGYTENSEIWTGQVAADGVADLASQHRIASADNIAKPDIVTSAAGRTIAWEHMREERVSITALDPAESTSDVTVERTQTAGNNSVELEALPGGFAISWSSSATEGGDPGIRIGVGGTDSDVCSDGSDGADGATTPGRPGQGGLGASVDIGFVHGAAGRAGTDGRPGTGGGGGAGGGGCDGEGVDYQGGGGGGGGAGGCGGGGGGGGGAGGWSVAVFGEGAIRVVDSTITLGAAGAGGGGGAGGRGQPGGAGGTSGPGGADPFGEGGAGGVGGAGGDGGAGGGGGGGSGGRAVGVLAVGDAPVVQGTTFGGGAAGLGGSQGTSPDLVGGRGEDGAVDDVKVCPEGAGC